MTSEASIFDYHFGDGDSAEDIPFELNANKPYVPVGVDGTTQGWFILDTGAVTMVVDTDIAAAIGLTAGDSYEATGAGDGSLAGGTGDQVALSVEGLDCTAGPIDILPLTQAIGFSEGRRIDGLLGYDFFAHFVVVLDYVAGRLALYDPRTFTYGGAGVTLPLDLVRNHPFISATVTTATGQRLAGRFLVDTGWRSALSLNAPFVAEHGLLDTIPTIEAITGVGIGGPTVEQVGRIATLELGALTVAQPVTNFSTAKAGILAQTDMAGIIGGEVLRRCTVIFDYSRKQMILAPNARFADAYEFDMAGLLVTAEGPDLRTFRVYRVLENSPATAAGLATDDLITALDGQATADLSLEQIRRLFRGAPGTRYALEIGRAGQRMNVTLRLDRLV